MRKSSAPNELKARVEAAQAAFAAGKPVVDQDLLGVGQRLSSNTQRVSMGTLYSTRDVSSQTTIKMFQPQDNIDKGIINVANAKLPKQSVFLVSSIILLAGVNNVAGAISRDSLSRLNYGSIADIPGLASGELTFRYRGKNLLDKFALNGFITDNDTRRQLGELVLDNPILLREEEQFEATIETGVALPLRTGLKFILCGATVVSN